MARESIDRLGFYLGVNLWCHISTAFEHKLGRFAEELLEEDGEDTIETLQASHSRTMENYIYSFSPDTLAGGAEDLLPQFLQASTNWQLLMYTVPGGLQLLYSNAREHYFKELTELEKFGSDFEDSVSDSHTNIALSALKASRFKKEICLNTDEIVDYVGCKLKERLITRLEEQLTTKMVDMLTPVLEGIVKEAVRTTISQQPAVTPTNDIDFNNIYE
ncbi:hypothetical protein EDD22DRAFT_954215 [Suillus occidentalis]|nr:hypothetical protein EDD22DRAFT_954215 [Suillus occidentalis]